jgi:hypothetical protein
MERRGFLGWRSRFRASNCCPCNALPTSLRKPLAGSTPEDFLASIEENLRMEMG